MILIILSIIMGYVGINIGGLIALIGYFPINLYTPNSFFRSSNKMATVDTIQSKKDNKLMGIWKGDSQTSKCKVPSNRLYFFNVFIWKNYN